MSFTLYIAKRYFFNRKTKRAVNIISFFSMLGVAIGTAALILLLSVFNGFENLLISMYNSFDSHIKITSVQGKTFKSQFINSQLKDHEDIFLMTDILEEKGLVKNNGHEFITTVKGVGDNFSKMVNLDTLLIQGESLENYQENNIVILGKGVAFHLSMGIGNMFNRLKIYLPNRDISPLISSNRAFSTGALLPIGIFSLGTDYDNRYIITPIKFIQNIIQKDEVSAIEINLKDPEIMLDFQDEIQKKIGDDYRVSNRLQQHAMLHKILSTERLAVFIILAFMLIIFTFNIIGSLSMLMIEKKNDIKTFSSLGMNQKIIQSIFLKEGMLKIITGSILGFIIGITLSLIQMKFGIIGFGEGNFIIDAYPVAIRYTDLILVELLVLSIGFFATIYPANVLSKRLIKT